MSVCLSSDKQQLKTLADLNIIWYVGIFWPYLKKCFSVYFFNNLKFEGNYQNTKTKIPIFLNPVITIVIKFW